MANLTRLSSLKGKAKDVSKKNLIYIHSTIKTEDTDAHRRQRAKPSKIRAKIIAEPA